MFVAPDFLPSDRTLLGNSRASWSGACVYPVAVSIVESATHRGPLLVGTGLEAGGPCGPYQFPRRSTWVGVGLV